MPIEFIYSYFFCQCTGPNQSSQPLFLKGPAPNLPPPPHENTASARRKGNGIDFDVYAEQPVERGMPTHSVVVGQAVLPSSSQGLGTVPREYLRQAPVLYEEFITGDLSQRIEEDKGLDLCHTLVRHALIPPQNFFF
ncbi:hypothetical protein ACOSP7_022390 [Xanthoceras sorbifolium]